VVADGFSCREQARQIGGSRAFHVAELVHEALRIRAPISAILDRTGPAEGLK
jgi:hypothetical protein